MVENQLRPNKINDPRILDLFKNIKKEDFLPKDIKEISYSDLEINLVINRGYLKNLHLAQLILSANIKEEYKVLHIGGLTGYVSVMLASLCHELIVIENQRDLIANLNKNINNFNVNNIKVINGEFKDGFVEESPYDVIFIDSPISLIPSSFKKQLCSNFGKMIIIKKASNLLCKAYRITKNHNHYSNEFLFDIFTKFELYKDESKFVF